MPIQIFSINRAPEEPPLKAEEIKRFLWQYRLKSEWTVIEVEAQPENLPD